MYADIYVNSIDKIPDMEHYAIVKTGSIHIEGDERSRTHPGHGYPAETKNYIEYEVYLTKEKLLIAIKELDANRRSDDFKVLHVKPVTVNKTVTLDLS
jgi:hypothetical protein